MSSQKLCKQQSLLAKDADVKGMPIRIERAAFGCSRGDLLSRLSSHDCLLRVWNVIEQRYSDETLRVADLARDAGASVSAMNRAARSASGLALYQILRRYRVLMAVSLLVTTDTPMLEVALAAGFGSSRSMEKAFATLLGMSQARLRRHLLKNLWGLKD